MSAAALLRMLHACAVLAATALGLVAPVQAAPTEGWLVLARLDSGDQLLFELTITDAGPGERNAAVIGRWKTHDGKLISFDKAKLGGAWTQSADGRRLDLEKFQLDRSAPLATLRAEKRSIRIALDFALPSEPAAARALAGGAWRQELWASAVPVSATLWAAGRSETKTRGRLALTHRVIAGREGDHTQRRGELFSLGAGANVYVAELASARGGERWVVARDASGRVIGDAVERVAAESAPHALPVRSVLATPSVSGTLLAGTRLAAYDPLAELPAAMRFLIGLRLHSSWMSSPFDLRVAGAAGSETLRGDALASYTFYGE
jgi:hypothetical protein